MIKYVFLILIILSAAGSGAGYYATTLWRSTLMAQDQQILTFAKKRLIDEAFFYQGNYFLPLGVSTTTGHALPINLIGARTGAKGDVIQYCPYSSISGIGHTETIALSETLSYTVKTANLITGEPFVIESAPAPLPGVLAILLIAKKSANVTCADLTTDADGRLTLSSEGEHKGVFALLHRSEFDAPSLSSWVSADENTDLTQILTSQANSTNNDITISLKPNTTYTLNDSITFNGNHEIPRRKLRIRTDPLAQPALITSETATLITLLGIDLYLENVVFDERVVIDITRGEHFVKDATLGQLKTESATVYLKNVTIGNSNQLNNAVEVINSTVYQHGNVEIISNGNLAIGLQHSNWKHASGALSLILLKANAIGIQLQDSEMASPKTVSSETNGAQALLLIDSSSKYYSNNALWTHVGSLSYGIYVEGSLNISNSQIGLNGATVGIYTVNGSRVTSKSSTVGSATNPLGTGWLDEGMLSAHGDLRLYSSLCQSGAGWINNNAITVQYTDETVTQESSEPPIFTPVTLSKTLEIPVGKALSPIQISCN